MRAICVGGRRARSCILKIYGQNRGAGARGEANREPTTSGAAGPALRLNADAGVLTRAAVTMQVQQLAFLSTSAALPPTLRESCALVRVQQPAKCHKNK